MGLVKLNCSNCGAELEFDEKQKIGFCSHCGTKHVLEDVKNTTINNISNEYKIENATINNGPTEESLLKRAIAFKNQGDLLNAYLYANKVLDINLENVDAKNIIEKSFYLCEKFLTATQVLKLNSLVKEYGNLPADQKSKNFSEIVIIAESFVCGSRKLYMNCSYETINLITTWTKKGFEAAYKESEENRKEYISNKLNGIENKKSLKPWQVGLIIFGVICAFSFILNLFAAIGGSNEEKNSNKQSSTAATTTTTAPMVNMGQTYSYKNIDYTITDATFCKYFPSTIGGTIGTDYMFVHVKIKIKNNSQESKNLYLSDFNLISPSRASYSAKPYVFMYNRMDNPSLAPGFEETYFMVFEIPSIENTGQYKLQLDLFLINPDPLIILNSIPTYVDGGIDKY